MDPSAGKVPYPAATAGGYPQQQAGFNPPPPYGQQQPPMAYQPQMMQPMASQQTSVNVEMVQQQQQNMVIGDEENPNKILIAAIIMTVFTGCCGCVLAWFCTIPSIILAALSKSAGDEDKKKILDKASRWLLGLASVGILVTLIIIVSVVAVTVSGAATITTNLYRNRPFYPY